LRIRLPQRWLLNREPTSPSGTAVLDVDLTLVASG